MLWYGGVVRGCGTGVNVYIPFDVTFAGRWQSEDLVTRAFAASEEAHRNRGNDWLMNASKQANNHNETDG